MKQNNENVGRETAPTELLNFVELERSDSIFQNIIFACHRWKQLNRGAHSRLAAADKTKRKNTSIAIEEIRQNLIKFKAVSE